MDALTEYRNFIANKKPVFGNHGFAVNPAQVNELLKPFQRDIVVWAVRKGRHVCPLQLGTIEHCVKLYSNPGEVVLTPFMGIGSEAYTALKLGRKAIGIELKETYYNVAVRNLKEIEAASRMPTLFDFAEMQMAVAV